MIDELKNIQPDSSFISEHSFDFVEESTFVISSIEESFDAIIADTMNETAEEKVEDAEKTSDAAEPTSESTAPEVEDVVTEGKAADIKDSVVAAIKAAWEKIKGAFTDVVSKIKTRVAEAKSKGLDKAIAHFEKQFDKSTIKADKLVGKLYAGENIGDTKWIDALKKCAVDTNADKLYADDTDEVPKLVANNGFGKSYDDNISVGSLKKDAKEYFLGDLSDVKGVDLKNAKIDISRILKGGQLTEVKALYNKTRQYINDFIKGTKAARKVLDDENQKAMDKKRINAGKRYVQVLTSIVFTQFGCFFKQYSQAFSIAMKVKVHIDRKKEAKSDKKEDKKEEKTNEAVEIFAW